MLSFSVSAASLKPVFRQRNFTVAGISELLTPTGMAALYRGDAVIVRRRCGSDPLGALIRVFILNDLVNVEELIDVLGEDVYATNLAEGLLRKYSSPNDGDEKVHSTCTIRPHEIHGRDHWVFSDYDRALQTYAQSGDYVPGVGAASLSLIAATPTSPVESLFDLGTGCGVQALSQLSAARRIVATDISTQALAFAEGTFTAAGVQVTRDGKRLNAVEAETLDTTVDLRQGSWFEPVAGERFDRIVANPPFVVSCGVTNEVYRDSGLDLDAASERVLSEAADYLKVGGTAHILASWVHGDASWQQRVASWFPDHGVAVWVLQRDVADPELYVSTWLRDGGITANSARAETYTNEWLDHFAEHGVTGVGYGFVAIERLADNVPSEITIEDFSTASVDNLGAEVSEFFIRSQWLRDRSREAIADSRFLVRPGVAIEDVSVADTETQQGFTQAALRITRTDGPRFSHTIDEALRTILAGLHPEGLSLRDVVGLYCTVHDLPSENMLDDAVTAIVDLVRHGVVLPAECVLVLNDANSLSDEKSC